MNKYCFLCAALALVVLIASSQSKDDIIPYSSNWRFVGPESMVQQNLGKVHALWINPSDQDHILAGAESGLWKTTNGGQNWDNLTDCCVHGIGIACIAVQPDDPATIYIGTGVSNRVKSSDHHYGYGIYKTTDGGRNWHHLKVDTTLKPKENYCYKIIVHPVFTTNLYALIGSNAYKSVDSGSSWTLIFGKTENPDKLMLRDIEINPQISSYDEVYISSSTHIVDWNSSCDDFPPCTYYCTGKIKFPTAKVWRIESQFNSASVQAGTMKDMCEEIPGYSNDIRIAMLSFTHNSLNIATQTESGWINIYRKKEDGPWTFTSPASAGRFNSTFSFPFAVSPANDSIIYLGGYMLFRSMDGGNTLSPLWKYWAWTQDTNYIGSHADIRDFVLYRADPSGNDIIYMGTDGGVGKTSNGGKATANLNGAGLQLTQFHGLSNSEKFPGLIYAGSQDNGVFTDHDGTWKCNVIGDAYDAVSDLIDPLVAYTTSNASAVFKTTSGGESWSRISCPAGENCMDKPLWVDDQNRLYLGANNLYRREGAGWVKITDIPAKTPIRSFKMTEDGNTAYLVYPGELWDGTNPACSFTGKVYKVTGIKTSPEVTDITACLEGIRWTSITDIAIEPVHGDKIWVCFGGFWESKNKVFNYENNTWQECGQGLPNIPANTIVYLKGSDDMLFIGMDDGVYYRAKSMSGWDKFSHNLPKTIVTDLEINYNLNMLRAATYGRGIWESPIPEQDSEPSH